jgi:hypothetical protein
MEASRRLNSHGQLGLRSSSGGIPVRPVSWVPPETDIETRWFTAAAREPPTPCGASRHELESASIIGAVRTT